MKAEDEAEDVTPLKNMGIKLFFTKKSSPIKSVKFPSHIINSVTSLLDKVALGNEEGGSDRTPIEIGEEGKVVHQNYEAVVEEDAHDMSTRA